MEKIVALLLVASTALAPLALGEDVPECRDVEDESLGVVDGSGGVVVDDEDPQDTGLWENTNYEPIDGIQTDPGTCSDRTGIVNYDADAKVAP
jgi:hypothetical protein